MTEYKEIKLEKIVNHTILGMRYIAENLFNDVINKNASMNILIDFQNITFMSRSFAQEYVYQKRNTNAEIVEKNMDDNVRKMFDVVIKSLKEEEIDVEDQQHIICTQY
ncbi:MAG: hypothetical protein LBT66_01625 [Methanobrevibacter sp.]|jgi:hypothetical protein|nr:hypothetical protein [Candidatus Methanovirga meridionalis]